MHGRPRSSGKAPSIARISPIAPLPASRPSKSFTPPSPSQGKGGLSRAPLPLPLSRLYNISSFTAPRITRQSDVRWSPSQYSRRLPSNGGRVCLPAPAYLLSDGFPASPRTDYDLRPESALP